MIPPAYGPVPVGTDNETDALFWNTSTVAYYTGPAPAGRSAATPAWTPVHPGDPVHAVAAWSVDCPVDGFEAPGTACSDGNACTTTDTCDGAGLCVGGPAPNCDDGNPCTVDSCDPVLGCVNNAAAATGFACSDGNACTTPDTCDGAGLCVGGQPPTATTATSARRILAIRPWVA